MAITAAPSVTNSSNAVPTVREVPGTSSAVKAAPVRPMPLVISSKSQSFPIVSMLGEGGNGRVWEVMTPRGVNHVAVKILRRGVYSEASALREIKNLQSVQGIPHVLQYLDKFNLNYMHYEDPKISLHHEPKDPAEVAILTELLPCPDCYDMFLEDLEMKDTSKVSLPQVMSIGKQALETLQALHAKGYLHRDIKPENMSYNPSTGKFKIFDFDVLEEVGQLDPLITAGTRQYRAPERILSTNYNETIDIWSLAASLFTLYVGEPLIPTENGGNLQPIVDHLHLLLFNMGKDLNPAVIESAPLHIRNLFIKGPNEKYVIAFSPSRAGKAMLQWQGRSKLKKRPLITDEYWGMKVWEARIYEAAVLKGESPSHAKALIDFIGPMLSYENRVTARDALENLNASKE